MNEYLTIRSTGHLGLISRVYVQSVSYSEDMADAFGGRFYDMISDKNSLFLQFKKKKK
jgi:hypothetical protein